MGRRSDKQWESLTSACGYLAQIGTAALFYFCMGKVSPDSRVPLTVLIALPAIILALMFLTDFFTEFLENETLGKVLRGLCYVLMAPAQVFALMNLYVALNFGISVPTTDRVVGFILGAVISAANLVGGYALGEKA